MHDFLTHDTTLMPEFDMGFIARGNESNRVAAIHPRNQRGGERKQWTPHRELKHEAQAPEHGQAALTLERTNATHLINNLLLSAGHEARENLIPTP